MERSTSKETATNTVKTVATDHVGVKAKDLDSSSSCSTILNKFSPKPKIQYSAPKTLLSFQLSVSQTEVT